jgi:DNA-binding IclR family transcriptional regulator
MPNKGSADGTGLSSVDNALRLLQLVQQRRVLRVADAADELGVARSTAYRLLAALRRRGFVTQDKPNGVYRPGWSLNEIGLAALEQLDIRRVARPVLEELREQTQETISLLLLEGHNVRFIDCVESPRSVRVGSRAGLVLPAHCTAGGKAILAALPDSELSRRYANGELESRTGSSIVRWDRLTEELAAVRRSGHAINLEEGENGISAVGVAIQDPIGAPVAGIAVAVPTSRLSTAAEGRLLAPALEQARHAITQLLYN